MPSPPQDRSDFTIAIICALDLEANAVLNTFDLIWGDLGCFYGQAQEDENSYTTGVLGRHNVVLAHMPGMGTTSAALVASHLRHSFPNIQLALVVGICGGVPNSSHHKNPIRLGDLVVSTFVVRYDFGRQYPAVFARKDTVEDSLGRPNQRIRGLLAKLQTQHFERRVIDQTSTYLDDLDRKNLGSIHPGRDRDFLYEATYLHKHHDREGSLPCEICRDHPDQICSVAVDTSCHDLGCDASKLLENSTKSPNDRTITNLKYPPGIHFGRIGSGNTVMKSGAHRDRIAEQDGIIAFEMEGAGTWDNLPSIIVKGVCDYADSHKNKEWQRYTADVAAAGAKAILNLWEHGLREMNQAVHNPPLASHLPQSSNTSRFQTTPVTSEYQPRHNSNEEQSQADVLRRGRSPTQRRSLHIMAQVNDVEGIRQALFIHGEDPNVRAPGSGYTPLWIAASFGNLESCLILFEVGCDVDTPSRTGQSPLAIAASMGFSRIVEELLRRGANPNGSGHGSMSIPLICAAMKDHDRIVGMLLSAGADDRIQRKEDGFTPLHVAIERNYVNTIDRLLENCHVLECASSSGLLPLHLAVRSAQTYIVKCLLDAGANIDAVDGGGHTFASLAMDLGRMDIVQLFIQRELNDARSLLETYRDGGQRESMNMVRQDHRDEHTSEKNAETRSLPPRLNYESAGDRIKSTSRPQDSNSFGLDGTAHVSSNRGHSDDDWARALQANTSHKRSTSFGSSERLAELDTYYGENSGRREQISNNQAYSISRGQIHQYQPDRRRRRPDSPVRLRSSSNSNEGTGPLGQRGRSRPSSSENFHLQTASTAKSKYFSRSPSRSPERWNGMTRWPSPPRGY